MLGFEVLSINMKRHLFFVKLIPSENLFLKLIDKYFYKCKRHQQYERDIALGKNDESTLEQHRISHINMQILLTVIRAISLSGKPNVKLDEYDLCLMSDLPKNVQPDKGKMYLAIQNNKLIYIVLDSKGSRVEGLLDIHIKGVLTRGVLYDKKMEILLKKYLTDKQKEKGRYFGDDLSDNSDSDDETACGLESPSSRFSKCCSKIVEFKLRESFQKSKEFWLTTKRKSTGTSPAKSVGNEKKVNAGLAGRLKNLVDRHRNKTVNDDYILKIIKGYENNGKDVKSLILKTINADLIERATLKCDDKKVKDDIDTLNKILKEKLSLSARDVASVETKFYIAQYRGINYMLDRWNAYARRYHRLIHEERLAHFSETVLRTLPYCFYTELDEKHDFTKEPNDQSKLYAKAVKLKQFMSTSINSGPCIDFTDEERESPYLFDNLSDRFQHRFSNGIDSHLKQLQFLRTQHPEFWGKSLPSAHNPAIATGDRPYHALKYTYGLKDYYENPLYPRYHLDGKLEYLHVGKVYVSLHGIEEMLAEDKPNRVSEMDRKGQVSLRDRVAPEKESSFISFVPEDKIFYQYVAKYPSFNGEYKRIYEIKYGLDLELYRSFQYLIQISEPESKLRESIIDLLSEWLCSYHEVLLLQIAQDEAKKRKNGVLIYLNSEGMLSFEPDNGRIFTPKSEPAKSVLMQREIRRQLALSIRNDMQITKDNASFPGFTLLKDKTKGSDLIKMFEEEPTKLDLIAAKIKMSEEEEASSFVAGQSSEAPIKQRKAKDELVLFQKRGLFFSEPRKNTVFLSPSGIANASHLYTDHEINSLLRKYLQVQSSDEFKAKILGATHPFVQGKMEKESKQDFYDRIKSSLKPGVISVLPVNLTNECIDEYSRGQIPGTHWIGLIIVPISQSEFTIKYIDPLELPDQDKSRKVLFLIMQVAADRLKINFQPLLINNQQQADLDCGAWTIDNIVKIVNDKPLRNRGEISGMDLRRQHSIDYNQVMQLPETQQETTKQIVSSQHQK